MTPALSRHNKRKREGTRTKGRGTINERERAQGRKEEGTRNERERRRQGTNGKERRIDLEKISTKIDKNEGKNTFFCKKICTYQKKAVPLHPISPEDYICPLPAEASYPINGDTVGSISSTE